MNLYKKHNPATVKLWEFPGKAGGLPKSNDQLGDLFSCLRTSQLVEGFPEFKDTILFTR
jgi:hypothetical protein